ncbi:predicted protein [Botrytis cinerea T4]|uniref:Uncharacterized protein n=1 Tax=Botryotinia fuckeliana (strain T4) TaxID=999810 RepID=G2YUP0_BOTF4|nr:predicted protein [Botrytis cinerea T4]
MCFWIDVIGLRPRGYYPGGRFLHIPSGLCDFRQRWKGSKEKGPTAIKTERYAVKHSRCDQPQIHEKRIPSFSLGPVLQFLFFTKVPHLRSTLAAPLIWSFHWPLGGHEEEHAENPHNLIFYPIQIQIGNSQTMDHGSRYLGHLRWMG